MTNPFAGSTRGSRWLAAVAATSVTLALAVTLSTLFGWPSPAAPQPSVAAVAVPANPIPAREADSAAQSTTFAAENNAVAGAPEVAGRSASAVSPRSRETYEDEAQEGARERRSERSEHNARDADD